MYVEKAGIKNADPTLDAALAVAGTGRGADTCCVIRANSSNRFFDIKVREIIGKPKEF